MAKKKKNEEIIEGELTNSDLDRMDMKSIVQKNLQGFLNNLVDRVQDEDEKITTQNLLQLFEIITDAKLRGETNIIALLKEQYKVEALKKIKELEDGEGLEDQENTGITNDDIKKATAAAKVLNNISSKLNEIEESEFSK
jgi:hypothetical protein